jgi:hypothetical protein
MVYVFSKPRYCPDTKFFNIFKQTVKYIKINIELDESGIKHQKTNKQTPYCGK